MRQAGKDRDVDHVPLRTYKDKAQCVEYPPKEGSDHELAKFAVIVVLE